MAEWLSSALRSSPPRTSLSVGFAFHLPGLFPGVPRGDLRRMVWEHEVPLSVSSGRGPSGRCSQVQRGAA